MNDLGFFNDPERDDVDQAIVVETFVEVGVAGDVGNADRVAVGADAVDRTLGDVTLMRVWTVEPAESQRVGDRDHLGAHAEHVTHDAADAGRRALERHDLRWMVVRFVGDHDTVAFAAMLAQMQDAESSDGPSTTCLPVVGSVLR